MKHICGRSHFEHKRSLKKDHNSILPELSSVVSLTDLSTINVYSSYLGLLPIVAKVDHSKSNVYLESIYITKRNRHVNLKVLDLKENRLDESLVYDPEQLLRLKPVCINLHENKHKYFVTLYCYLRINEIEKNTENIEKYTKLINELIKDDDLQEKAELEYPELFENTRPSEVKRILQEVTAYNSRVDILFAAREYLEFINAMSDDLDTVNDQDTLIFISGVPNLDNAYWNGQYMIFGEGDTMFYPLTSIDVIGHELSHGLVQGICDLEYKGHSGALNESYADILGAMLEFYVYEKYPKLLGKSDWLIGEDLAMTGPCLRSMSDPNLCEQPCKMSDPYYTNPTSMIDYGGVHINSGIPNYCFYLASQKIDKYKALQIFLKCLFKLKPDCDFTFFSNVLQHVTQEKSIIDSLEKVELFTKKQKPRPLPIPTNNIPQPIPSPYSNSSQYSDQWQYPDYLSHYQFPVPVQVPFPSNYSSPTSNQQWPSQYPSQCPIPYYTGPFSSPIPIQFPQQFPQSPYPCNYIPVPLMFTYQ